MRHLQIKRDLAAGMPVQEICKKYGIIRSELYRILGEKPRRQFASERDKAIAELLAEGFTAEQIAAVFGE